MKRILFIENFLLNSASFGNWIENSLINHIPIHAVRRLYYKNVSRMNIGVETSICLYTEIRNPRMIRIGNNTAINQKCYLDGRGGLTIGENVNVGRCVNIYTAGHDYNDPNFKMTTSSVTIEDDVWIASNVLILPGVKIKRGAVVAAGSIVVKDVEEFTVVAGNPAKEVKKRNKDISYRTSFFKFFY